MLGTAVDPQLAGPPGYFGKIMSFSDFVSRRLPRNFIEPWDDWLQQSVLSSKERLGPGWNDIYLTSPIWRFVLSRGVCGPTAWAGVLMPSIDRVGRHFPLTLAVEMPDAFGPLAVLAETAWFEGLEELALSTLDEPFDVEAFDALLQRLVLPSPAGELVSRLRSDQSNTVSWCFGLGSAAAVPQSLPAIAESLLAGVLQHQTFWWTSGSEKVTPCLLVFGGLPTPASYAALLDGDWSRWGWVNWI
ncbi:MAG TPA: type VI secretion system-associated protein TagF [Burkholderiales bacterium]|nr:type VI secretion system-associated protein TagF [Burkholderiales bacterium]